MSNNIYDILKKMQNLEAPKQSLTESKKSKPDYIDIDKDGDKKEPMKKAAKEKSKGAVAEAVAQVEQQLAEKYQGFKKIDEDALDFLRSPEGIAKNRADQARSEQNFADRSAKHFAGQIGDQYHSQLMKTVPSYRDEYIDYMSQKEITSPKTVNQIKKELQAKHDPMGGPTNIDYEKIKKNPMSTRAGEQGSDWRPWGPGPKDSFDSDKFGRPVREGEMEESGLQAYLGKKKYGKEGMQALQKAGRDGASKEKMAQIRARHDKMDEDAYNEDMLSPKQKKIASMAGDPDKIDANDLKALRAGKKKKDEGNAFSGALDAARDAGKGEFKVGGKEYKVQEDDGDFTGDMDDRGNLQLSPAGAAKVQKHSNYDPKLSANAQYSKHFDDRGNQRMTHDQAVEVGKNPKYNPNLPANAQWDLLNKSGDAGSVKEGRTSMREGWEEMQKYLEKKRGPESKGDAGKKAGTRYGGSAQKDDDNEDLDGEGKPAVKKKGRPKGTGGGAKFNFKKPKD
jgi:hypothetical protein